MNLFISRQKWNTDFASSFSHQEAIPNTQKVSEDSLVKFHQLKMQHLWICVLQHCNTQIILQNYGSPFGHHLCSN
jgi:hypothetical protein